MDVSFTYAEFLNYFLALIVVGVSLKYRWVDSVKIEPVILMGKKFNKYKISGFLTIFFLGVVIQVVADTVRHLQSMSLFNSPVVMGGFVLAFIILITAQ